MVAGGAVYAEVYPAMKANILPIANYGKITFPAITGLSPWLFIAALAAAAGLLFFALRSRRPIHHSQDKPVPREG